MINMAVWLKQCKATRGITRCSLPARARTTLLPVSLCVVARQSNACGLSTLYESLYEMLHTLKFGDVAQQLVPSVLKMAALSTWRVPTRLYEVVVSILSINSRMQSCCEPLINICWTVKSALLLF